MPTEDKHQNRLLAKQIKRFSTDSEIKIENLLKTQPYIQNTERWPDKYQNIYIKDIMVFLNPQAYLGIFHALLHIPDNFVWVEVKQTKNGIYGYIQEIHEEHNFSRESSQCWLARNKQILLVGEQEEADILQDFETKLQNINNFWTL